MDGVYVRKFVKKGPEGIIWVKNTGGVYFPAIAGPFPDLQEGETVSIKNYLDYKTLASFPVVVDPNKPMQAVSSEIKEVYFKLVNKDLHDRIGKLEESRDRFKKGNAEEARGAIYWREKYKSLYNMPIGNGHEESDDPDLDKIAHEDLASEQTDENGKSIKFWRDNSDYWYKAYEELINRAPKKGRKVSMFKKAAILLTIGALAGNIPFSEITESTKEFFSGSDTVLTGDYQQVSVCSDCKENFGTWNTKNDVIICGQCGSRNIKHKVAADLYRDRTFPMLDKVVGTRFRNEDGTTTIVLDDGDTIITEEI